MTTVAIFGPERSRDPLRANQRKAVPHGPAFPRPSSAAMPVSGAGAGPLLNKQPLP